MMSERRLRTRVCSLLPAAALAVFGFGGTLHAAPPVNDACGSATQIALNEIVTATLAEAVSTSGVQGCQPQDNNHRDIWYTVNVSAPGVYEFSASPTIAPLTFNLTLSLHPACGQASVNCGNRTQGAYDDSLVSFTEYLTPGAYLLRVAGNTPNQIPGFDASEFQLAISGPSVPVTGDRCDNPIPLAVNTELQGTMEDKTHGPSNCPSGIAFFDVWYSLSVPTSGKYFVSFGDFGDVGPRLAVYNACSGAPIVCSMSDTSSETGFPVVFASAVLDLTPGTYYLRGWRSTNVPQNTFDPGTYTAKFYRVPSNDECGSAIALALSTPTAGYTHGATTNSGDPVPYCDTFRGLDHSDVWYKFTASVAGWYEFVVDTPHDSVSLTLQDGCGGSVLSCYDNGGNPHQPTSSTVGMAMAVNQVIYIRILANEYPEYANEIFSIQARIVSAPTALSNDSCTEAVAISVGDMVSNVDIRGASSSIVACVNEPYFGQQSWNHGAWYKVVFPSIPAGKYGQLRVQSISGASMSTSWFVGFCGALTNVGCRSFLVANDRAGSPIHAGTNVFLYISSAANDYAVSPLSFRLTFEGPFDMPRGKCEVGTACTSEVLELDCLAANGVWVSGSTCLYGTCMISGNCTSNVLESACIAMGGTWQMQGNCPRGSCVVGLDCTPNLYKSECVAMGGVWTQGAQCGAPGGCCAQGGCSIKTLLQCDAVGGTFLGQYTTCDPVGAAFGTNNTSTPIPDNGAENNLSPITFVDDGYVNKMVVTVDMVHPRAQDLSLWILGSSYTMLLGRSSTGTACVDFKLDGTYIFDQSAATDIITAAMALPPGSTVPSGRYRPGSCPQTQYGPADLGALSGVPIADTWYMDFQDGVSGQAGTLRSWSLEINGGVVTDPCPCPADFNADGGRDVADLFAYINAWLAKTANADFNDDNGVDVADLFAYINAWLAGC